MAKGGVEIGGVVVVAGGSGSVLRQSPAQVTIGAQ